MDGADLLGPTALGDAGPVDEPERRCQKPANDSRPDDPVGDVGQLLTIGDQVKDVEDDGGDQEPQRERDQLLMHGVAEELDSTLDRSGHAR